MKIKRTGNLNQVRLCMKVGIAVLLTVILLTTNIASFTSAANSSEVDSNEFAQPDCYQYQNEAQNEQDKFGVVIESLLSIPTHPSSGTIGANDGVVTNRLLISNAVYFTTAPMHGKNAVNTCGAVAVQLMLSYHNYYSDRRIIAPQYLHGWWNASGSGNVFENGNYTSPEESPNVCTDPSSMTSWTIGSNQDYHDYIVNNYVPGDSLIMGLERGMKRLLEDRSSVVIGNIEFTTRNHHALGIFAISTDGPMAELNAGRPVILGMYNTLGGIDHYVVAYGYQHLNGRFGYVVHYGSDDTGTTNHTFSWIDAAWVNSYSALEVNHAHDHSIDEGSNVGNDKRAVRCGECGHRALSELYNVSNNAIISSLYPLSGSITIPAAINGTSITKIGNSAFANQMHLSQITIPASITDIGEYAFLNSSLRKVTFQGGTKIRTIGRGAFQECSVLEQIYIPYGVTTIGESAFKNTALLKLIIPYTVVYVGDDAFSVNNSDLAITWQYNSFLTAANFSDYLAEVVIFDYVSSISAAAFMNCQKLKQITIPNTISGIGTNAFNNCTSLETIIIPNNLAVISESLFYGCSSLTSLIIPNGVTCIKEYAFYGCSSITSLVIPDSVLTIGEGAFNSCSGLTDITLPNNLLNIEGSTFSDCSSLSNITLPSTLQIIGLHSFVNCSSLNSIVIPNSVIELQTEAFYGCSTLTSLIIGSGVTKIGDFAFMYCTSLTQINIPDNVVSISSYAFFGCSSLWSVYIQGDYQSFTTLGVYAFDSCHPYLNILVPKNCFIEYKTGEKWSQYSSSIISMTALPEYGLDCHANSHYSAILEAGKYEVYILHVDCAGNYEFTVNADSVIQMALYNENMSLIGLSPIIFYDGTMRRFQQSLTVGVYYFMVEFESSPSSGTIETSIESLSIEQIWIGSNKNALNHLHDGRNQYVFYNNYAAQFITLTLTATKNGTVLYPQGSVTVRNSVGVVFEKVEIADLSNFLYFDLDAFYNLAKNVDGSNSLTLLLPYTGAFVIEVYYPNYQVTSLTLSLSTIETYTEDLFQLNTTSGTEISQYSTTSKGDEIKQINLLQAGRFNFSIQGLSSAFFVILKEVRRLDGFIIFESIIGEVIDSTYSETIDLKPGLYYIGYFNAASGQALNFSIYRDVSQYNQNYLIADPSPGQCGTEVTLNGRGYGLSTVTQGFTRLIFFTSTAPLTSISRLDYYWYSSDPSALAISEYGTVLGLTVAQDTSVKIMAVYKYDSSIVFVMDFIVLKETETIKTDPIIINVNMNVSSGTSYYIDLSTELVPINLLQHYTWSSNNSIHIDTWGRFTVPVDASGQIYTFTGSYKLNPKVLIIVTVFVV